MSALDAAAQVLAASAVPMRAKEMFAAMEANGLRTSPGGKTPEATLYAAISSGRALPARCTPGSHAHHRRVDGPRAGQERKTAEYLTEHDLEDVAERYALEWDEANDGALPDHDES